MNQVCAQQSYNRFKKKTIVSEHTLTAGHTQKPFKNKVQKSGPLPQKKTDV